MAGVDCLQAMIFLAFLLLTAVHAQYPSMAEEEMVPVQTLEYRPMAPGSQPFATCGACRCCSKSNSNSCVQTRCCFGIKCNLPGKPFGTCAFSPLNCDCGPNNCAHSKPSSSSSSSAHLVV